jgi:hypothetical protein
MYMLMLYVTSFRLLIVRVTSLLTNN